MRSLTKRLSLSPDILYLAVLFITAAWVFLVGLGDSTLQLWDEGIYASIARNMLERGDWVIPHSYYPQGESFAYQPWLEKPPLVLWFQAASMIIFGVSEFAVRFPSAFAAVLTTGIVYLFGRDLHGRRAGFLAGVVYLSIPYVYSGNNAGRMGGTDMPLVFFGTLFVYFTWRVSQRDDRALTLSIAVAAATLAALSKGVAAGAFVIVLAPLVIGRWRSFATRRVLVASVAGLVAVFAWPIVAYLNSPGAFVNYFIQDQILGRITGETVNTASGAVFEFMAYPYFKRLPFMIDPWLFVLLPALGYLLWSLATGQQADQPANTMDWLFVLWWGAAIVALYVFTGNHQWYLLPAFVPLTLVSGRLLADASEGVLGAIIGLVVGAVLTAVLSMRVPGPMLLDRWYYAFGDVSDGWLFTAGIAIFLGTLALAGILRYRYTTVQPYTHLADGGSISSTLDISSISLTRTTTIRVLVVVIAIGFVFATSAPVTIGASGYEQSQTDLGQAASEHTPPNATIYTHPNVTAGSPFHVFRFYSGNPLVMTTTDDLAENSSIQYAVVTRETLKSLDQFRTLATGENMQGRNITLIERESN